MIDRDAAAQRRFTRLSIARTLRVALIGLTLALAVIGALGVAALYDSRQTYENALSDTASLEVGAANLLSAAVALQANLARPRSQAAAHFVQRAASGFDRGATQVRMLAADDAESRALVRRGLVAQDDARVLAQHPTVAGARRDAPRGLRSVAAAAAGLAARQRVRRSEARATATRRSRAALLAIGIGGGLALVAVLAFLTVLIRTMRRPLDELVDATRRMAAGDLAVRVRPAGPRELSALGEAFNVMGEDLATAGRRIEAQRQRLATTIESLGDGLVICDGHDRVSAMNPRARELVSELRPGAVAHGPGSPLPPLAQARAGELTIVHAETTMAVTVARLAGPEGDTAWTLRDVSERARLERAKTDFVATASHELRSPLTSIKGFIELLGATNTENLTERQLEFIRIALQSTDRLVELVNDLLDVARIEAGEFEVQLRSSDLRPTVEEVAELMQPRLTEKRQQLIVEVRGGRPATLADPVRVRQIVTNLVTNAHLYTAEGGTITVRLEGDGRATRIAVADSGRGMSEDEVGRVFDRFYRGEPADRRGPGTGLGLSIVRSLIDMHGGSIAVDSRLGVGSTFTVTLPAAGATAGQPPSPIRALGVAEGR